MRPIKVTMQAFGPYINKTVCDFTLLSDNSLFLITGSTGSGKTTILDAMSFALYGYATGLMRTFKDMRNTAAPENLDTYTEFIFDLAGKTYKFIRSVEIRKKRSGEREEKEDAECYVKSGDEWELIDTGNKKVSQRAAELLGFTHSQFSQVIVLPQGEFRKLLLASSKEKADILQTLFATGRWQLIIDAAVQKSRDLKAEYDELSGRLSALLDSAGASSEEELNELSSSAKEKLSLYLAESERCSAEAEQARIKYEQAKNTADKFELLKSLNEQFLKLKEQSDEIDNLREKLKLYDKILAVRPFLAAYKAADDTVKSTNQRLYESRQRADTAKKAYETNAERAKSLDEMKEQSKALDLEIERLKSLLPAAAEYNNTLKSAETESKALALLNAHKAKLNEEIVQLDIRIRKNQEYIESSYKKYIENYPAYLKEFSMLKEAADKRRELQSAEEKLQSAKKTCSDAETKLSNVRQDLSLSEERYKQAEKLFLENAAYSLAASLTEGTPCPVCGSVHHPAHAKAPAGAVNKRRLDELKSETDNLREKYNCLSAELAGLHAECKSAEENYRKISDALNGVPAENSIRLSELEKLIEESDSYKEVYKRQSAALEKLRSNYSEKRTELDEISAQCSEKASLVSALNAKCSELKRRLPQDINAAGMEERIKLLQHKLEKITSEALHIQRALDESIEALHKSNAECNTLSKSLEESEKALSDAYNQFTQKCIQSNIGEDIAASPLPPDDKMSELKGRVEAYTNDTALLSCRIDDLKAELKDVSYPDMAAAEEELSDKKAKESEAAQQLGSMRQRLENIEAARAKLAELISENEKIAAKIDRYTRISDMLMGRNLHRTTLQGFVLGLMLDEVVLAACRYLGKLSRGRFALVRVDTEGGKAQHGLDIEVMDAYLGSQRKIYTLSGGELFLASLSLAFGLAEVVQNYSGGTRFDSIFIDEGFGSLDASTLNLAMDAFDEIRRDGRMVGIISHVEELKERISARVEVISSSDGSHIKIIN